MRSVLYRFRDLDEFERLVRGGALEPVVPAGEAIDDGEWVLAIFELGGRRRATSAAGRATALPEGMRLTFEPRDLHRMAEFAASEARAAARQSAPDLDATPSSPKVRGPDSGGEPPSGDESKPRRATVTSRPAGPPPRVLVVDDDPDIRDVVSAMLGAVGLSVATVGSAEDALDRARAEAFDLVLLDWNLPKMTGLELCRLLRDDPPLADMPVLFLTANASSNDMVEAFASGADDYVVKPFRAPELSARIFSLLRRARSSR